MTHADDVFDLASLAVAHDEANAFDAVVPPLLRSFRPQILVSQHGCDSHRLDPLAHLELSIDAQRTAQAWLHHLAHETAGGRWLRTDLQEDSSGSFSRRRKDLRSRDRPRPSFSLVSHGIAAPRFLGPAVA